MKPALRGKRIVTALAVLFALAVAGLCPYRIWLMLKRTEHVSGFYTEGSPLVIYGFFAVMAVFLLAIFATSLSNRQLRKEEFTLTGRHIPLAVVSLALGVSILPEAFKNLRGEFPRSIMIVENEATVVLMTKIEGALGIAAFVYFVFAAIAFLTQGDLLKKLRLASLLPVLWSASRALRFLVVTVSIIRVADLLLEMLGIVTTMLFFLTYARAVTEVGTGSYGYKPVAMGLVSAIITLSYAVPRCILSFIGDGTALTAGYPFRAFELALPVFAVTFALTLLLRGVAIDRDPDDPVELPEKPVDEPAVKKDLKIEIIPEQTEDEA